jgi:hypothetical protein
MTETEIKKLYVSPDGMVTFICPKCGNARKESVLQYKDSKVPVKVDCICTNVYEVKLEFRKFYRKETNLVGFYVRSSQSKDWGKMVVKNLSMGGCGAETSKTCTLVRGEEINLEFTLDDRKRSKIKKKAVVVALKEQYIGCRFCASPGSFDADLGFYLRNP